MFSDSAGCATFSRCAAAVKVPTSATSLEAVELAERDIHRQIL